MSGPCPVCHTWWRYLRAHLWAAHGELWVMWIGKRP